MFSKLGFGVSMSVLNHGLYHLVSYFLKINNLRYFEKNINLPDILMEYNGY